MESDLCKAVVRNELTKLGFHFRKVELGKVELKGNISNEQLRQFDISLKMPDWNLCMIRIILLLKR